MPKPLTRSEDNPYAKDKFTKQERAIEITCIFINEPALSLNTRVMRKDKVNLNQIKDSLDQKYAEHKYKRTKFQSFGPFNPQLIAFE